MAWWCPQVERVGGLSGIFWTWLSHGLYLQDDGSFTETLDPDLRDRRRGEAPCRRISPNQSGYNRLGLMRFNITLDSGSP